MSSNNFEKLFGENLVEAAGITPPSSKKKKPKLVALEPPKDEPETVREGQSVHIGIHQITVNKQHRQEFTGIEELAESIKSQGLLQPVLLRPRSDHTYELVAGERRLRAVKMLGRKTVPCVIRSLTDGESAAIQLAENLQRKDLNPIEEARGFADVIQKNSFTYEQVGKLFGRDKGTISRSLQLLKLPPDIQDQVAKGELPARKAIELARLPNEVEQRRTLDAAKSPTMTTEQTRALVQKRVGKTPTRKPKEKTLSFPVEHGKITVTVSSEGTYHHVKAALDEALEDVQTRIDNGVNL